MIEQTNDKVELEEAKNQLLYEAKIERELKKVEETKDLGGILMMIKTLNSFSADEESGYWKEKA
ncbi:MAG: hypothetical protein NY202_02525 [Mollicutes bacterium UO1]